MRLVRVAAWVTAQGPQALVLNLNHLISVTLLTDGRVQFTCFGTRYSNDWYIAPQDLTEEGRMILEGTYS